MVVDAMGDFVQVRWVVHHPSRVQHLVEVTTSTTQLTVTARHRIRIKTVRGEEECLAKDVLVGMWVVVGRRPEELVGVSQYRDETEIIEVAFENDAFVEAWPLPIGGGLVTGGQTVENIGAPLQQCREELADGSSIGVTDASGNARTRKSRRSRRRFDDVQRCRHRTPSPD